MDYVILVDEQDVEVGVMEKLEAHQKGLLHRAFSVLVFNSKGEILLQKRAHGKYHSAGLWTNTCCSHPQPGEPLRDAAKRRLKYEMGIELMPEIAFKFRYNVNLDSEMIENEMDYVLVGTSDAQPSVNKQEVDDWKYVAVEELKEDIRNNPDHYTHWFKLIMNHPKLETAQSI